MRKVASPTSPTSSSSSLSDNIIKKILLSYSYVAIWIFLSFSVIIYNKYILDPKLYNWSYPISLTMIHMLFCLTLAFILVHVFKIVDLPASMSLDMFAKSVVPIGLLYSMSLWSVGRGRIRSYQIGFDSNNAYFQSYFEPYTTLFVSWIFVELSRLREASSFQFDVFIFGTNSLCAFALNLAVFLLVGKTSALTKNIAGVVKDWLLIAFSWSDIKDHVTGINLFGYGIAFLGVGYYNHTKLQAMKANEAQKNAAKADEETGRLLEEREGGDLVGKRSDSEY